VLISHDQAFLNNVVEETIILRNKTLEYFEGTPAAFEVNERKRAKQLTSAQESLDKKREHVGRVLSPSYCFHILGRSRSRSNKAKKAPRKLGMKTGVH
jgi:ATPase subunit of ABC transporter with duplicated ATPase domains